MGSDRTYYPVNYNYLFFTHMMFKSGVSVLVQCCGEGSEATYHRTTCGMV